MNKYYLFDITECKNYDELPDKAKKYVQRIEELTETPIKFIGTGPSREDTIIRDENLLNIKDDVKKLSLTRN